ncbi:exopolysaccharide biosynthesis WecB/TagA/CpsF family protein [Arthrobacter sp. JUb119]|nr:exopolysaccharide biosynthesis WecB/TagA/CpsF family protein [Arthrobacter sp. JUb119]
MTDAADRADLAGIVVDLLAQDEAVHRIINHALHVRREADSRPAALSVVSANLDHIVQFGHGGRWQGTLGDSLHPTWSLRCLPDAFDAPAMQWLNLLDGAPLVLRAQQLTGRRWPRLAGSDLIGPILDEAAARGLRVGFLGGQPAIQAELAVQLAQRRPKLQVCGFWAPQRQDIEDEGRSLRLAEQIRASGTEILVVGLGKPRQELWMASYGALTGASVLLAFGAVVDFLAGTVRRAPQRVAGSGLEWAWRLGLEPRRLARRYLVDDPPGLVALQRRSQLLAPGTRVQPLPEAPRPVRPLHQVGNSRFITGRGLADVAVLAVTYNNADSVDQLIGSLRAEASGLRLRVVIADNGSSDTTLAQLSGHDDVIVIPTGSNLGYAGGINAARRHAGDSAAVLVLNPDLAVGRGAISSLLQRLRHSQAGIVVPRLLEANGRTYTSLRREPNVARAAGDALFGERLAQRPGWGSEIDYDPESYAHPHRIDWATGAALLIDSALERRLGPWDEQFFLYSEETDYFKRARDAGASIWYEPAARMTHEMGGSGASVQLESLMAVNRIRYARKHQPARTAALFRTAVIGHEALRSWKPERRGILRTVVDEPSWATLPAATGGVQPARQFPSGTVIIPAHNEAAVIARTLEPLQPLARAGLVQVIVSCNGCTDGTAQIARGFDGIQVIEASASSKVAALNKADAQATRFPRLYLDADIEIAPSALRMVFEHLATPGMLSARPAFAYDTTGASWLVKSFYRARRRIPGTNQALWGAGAYGLSREGRARFADFPAVLADDLFIDQQFTAAEKTVLPTVPVQVKTPRNAHSLLAILRRNYRGQHELHRSNAAQPSTRSTLGQLLASVSGPFSAWDALVYAGMVVLARVPKKPAAAGPRAVWERDDSSRQAA